MSLGLKLRSLLGMSGLLACVATGQRHPIPSKGPHRDSKSSISKAIDPQTKLSGEALIVNEVPAPLMSLLKSLGRLKLSLEFANYEDGKTVDGSETLQKLETRFELEDSFLIHLISPEAKLEPLEASLAPTLQIGHGGMQVALNGKLSTDGKVDASLRFEYLGQPTVLPVLLHSKRLGVFQISIHAIDWTAEGMDPSKNLLSQYISLKVDCHVATRRHADTSTLSDIPCGGSMEFDPETNKWFFKIQLNPTAIKSSELSNAQGCPQDPKKIEEWLNQLLPQYRVGKDLVIPQIIDHPLGGNVVAQGMLDESPYREYWSNFLVRVASDEIYLGPKHFGLVLRIPRDSWIFVCGDTRPTTSEPFIDISFFKVKSAWFSSKKWVAPGPIKVRWRPLSSAADSVATQDVPLVREFFGLLRDLAAPIQDATLSAIADYSVDKIRLTTTDILFASRGNIAKVIQLPGQRKIESRAFEQVLDSGRAPNPPKSPPPSQSRTEP